MTLRTRLCDRLTDGDDNLPLGLTLLCAAIAATLVFPLAWLVIEAVAVERERALDLVFSAGTAEVLANSLLLMAGVTGFSIVVGVPLAYLTARTDLPFRRFWSVAAALPLVVPSYVGAFSFVSAFGPQGEFHEALAPLGVERVPEDETHRYGVVSSETVGEGLSRVNGIVEKPKPAEAPSNLAVIGRYILTPGIFEHLSAIGKGAGGEIQLTDAIARQLAEETFLAWEFEGRRFDCGDKLGYLEATVEYALHHPELRDAFSAYLSDLDARPRG